MLYKFLKTSISNFDSFSYNFAEDESDGEVLELVIKNKKYCLPTYSQELYYEEDKILVINLWNKIVFFSSESGKILFYSGLLNSFVGIESIDYYFVIITETTVFKLNKSLNFVYDFLSFPYIIKDYRLSSSKSKLTIKFVDEENEDDVLLDL